MNTVYIIDWARLSMCEGRQLASSRMWRSFWHMEPDLQINICHDWHPTTRASSCPIALTCGYILESNRYQLTTRLDCVATTVSPAIINSITLCIFVMDVQKSAFRREINCQAQQIYVMIYTRTNHICNLYLLSPIKLKIVIGEPYSSYKDRLPVTHCVEKWFNNKTGVPNWRQYAIRPHIAHIAQWM